MVNEPTHTKSKGLPIDIPYIYLILFTRAVPRTKSKGLQIDIPYIYLMLFTCTAQRTKTKGLPIDIPYIYFILFICAAPRTKSKGLPIDVPNCLSSNIFCPHRLNRSQLTYHHTFHTQQSSTYGKQGASIYLYPLGIQ
jgi:hypothetical protein